MPSLIFIDKFTNKYNENLLSTESLLTESTPFNYSGGGSLEMVNEFSITQKSYSAKMYVIQDVVFGYNSSFDLFDALKFTTKKAGNYIFSFVINPSYIGAPLGYYTNLSLEVYINAALTYTFTQQWEIGSVLPENFYTFAQSFDAGIGTNINFKFRVERPSVGGAPINFVLNFSGFKLEIEDKTNEQMGLPTSYSLPVEANLLQRFGVWNYNHGGSTQAISAGVWTHILNDGAGSATILGGAYPDIVIYDTTTSLFDYTGLIPYDSIDNRFDANITTTAVNQEVRVRLLLSIGGANIPLTFISTIYKSAGTYPLFGSVRNDILANIVKDYPARFEIFSDNSCTLALNGWNTKLTKQLS